MGKKSKRRTGKRSQTTVVKNAGARDKAIAPSIEVVEPKIDDRFPEEDEDEFNEFMLWSLADKKADLTPKRFARVAPHMAMKLIAGDFSIDDILRKRHKMLGKMEDQITRIETYEILEGIKFDNEEIHDEFLKQCNESLRKFKKAQSSRYATLYNSFQEVSSKLKNREGICLDDSFYFGKSQVEFDYTFCRVIEKKISKLEKLQSLNFEGRTGKKIMLVFRKYYFHPTAREESFREGIKYRHKALFSLLNLYREMHKCWRCNQLHGKGNETKSLICARCKCAVYCSRECQVKHWTEDTHPHKECCKEIGLVWSTYEARKKRVERAFREGRIFTKPVIVDGIEKECFLRPCEQIDYRLCTTGTEISSFASSMDAFYENIATLACGGKHILFGDETITPQLQEKIRVGYEDVLSEFDPSIFTEDEIIALLGLAEVLKLKNESYDKITVRRKESVSVDLSIDRFITLYICYDPFHLHKQNFFEEVNKFTFEIEIMNKLQRLRLHS